MYFYRRAVKRKLNVTSLYRGDVMRRDNVSQISYEITVADDLSAIWDPL